MEKFILLSKREVFGNKRLNIFKKIDIACESTSFANLLSYNRDSCWWLSSTSFEIGAAGFLKKICVATSYGPDYSYDDNDGRVKVRPVMKYSNLQQFKTGIQTTGDGVIEVEYGEYPQEQVDEELCDKLEKNYLNDNPKLKRTGKEYTIEIGYNGNNKIVPLKQLVEYEFEGKKYVRFRGLGDYVWLEVSPIEWYVDETKKLLISKKLLIGDVSYGYILKFLNIFFAEEIVQKSNEIKGKNKAEIVDTGTVSKEVSTIEKIISEIHKYSEGNPDKDAIITKLVKMTDDYNSKLDNIGVMTEKNIPSLDTYEGVTYEFELKLNMLLTDVKSHHEKYKEYFEMLSVLDKYIALVNGNKDEEYGDDFTFDLAIIMDTCLPFLKEEDATKIKYLLIDAFEREKKEVTDYIGGKSEILYKTTDEMKINLRKKFQPILEGLSVCVNKRDIEVEIKTSIKKIIDGLFEKPQNEVLSFYLVEINNIYTNINGLLNKLPQGVHEKYKEEMLSIMDMQIDYNKDFNSIANDLKKMWLSLNKVLYKINDYLGKIDRIKTGHININKLKN